ncbi:BnaAnng15640D, partial [Brassica napus]
SPFPSDRFVSPPGSFRLSPGRIRGPGSSDQLQTGFRAISGASVSANTSNSKTVFQLDDIYDDATVNTFGGGVRSSVTVPLGGHVEERTGLFMSGPIERGASSGPLDLPGEEASRSDSAAAHFSAPLGGGGGKKRRKRKKSLSWHTKQRPWVLPVSNFNDLQWALGKAGEDRVQLAVFEKQGWLFAGIYDGFNGPDAPEFLMANLYRAVHSELQGLFWELEEEAELEASSSCPAAEKVKVRKKLHELLAEAQAEDALDLSGSDRFAFSVEDNAVSVGSKRCCCSHGSLVRKAGAVDHELVLKAMSNGLEATEQAFLEMTEKVLETNPELALMGSCLLVALMRDDDVYVMNIGDSRALVAQCDDLDRDGGNKESSVVGDEDTTVNIETPSQHMKLVALQLTTDHSTSIEDEVTRIKNEHPDDNQCIVNDRVKGRLKVTRAFGAGFLKQPKLNDSLLEMFRNEYIGTDPYISCTPSLRHYRLTESDQFMVLSSDGLYQYLSNEEVVSLAMEKFPDGDPAQHVIQELLVRAAKKAGMGFHELLDIPQGDRRKYHDDCTVLVIALGGSRIWKSSGKYL